MSVQTCEIHACKPCRMLQRTEYAAQRSNFAVSLCNILLCQLSLENQSIQVLILSRVTFPIGEPVHGLSTSPLSSAKSSCVFDISRVYRAVTHNRYTHSTINTAKTFSFQTHPTKRSLRKLRILRKVETFLNILNPRTTFLKVLVKNTREVSQVFNCCVSPDTFIFS